MSLFISFSDSASLLALASLSLRDVRAVRNRRNKIIHAHWQVPDSLTAAEALFPPPTSALSSPVSRSIKAKGEIKPKEQKFDPLEIKNTAQEITALIIRLFRVSELLPKVPSSAGIGLAEPPLEQTQNPDPNSR